MSIRERLKELDDGSFDELKREIEQKTENEAERERLLTENILERFKRRCRSNSEKDREDDTVTALLLIEKRLTNFDLDEDEDSLSIPGVEFKMHAHQILVRHESIKLRNGCRSLPVLLIEYNGDEPVGETSLRLKKLNNDYVLTQGWNQVWRRKEKKFKSVDGLHAVIQLYSWRYHRKIYFGLIVAEEAKAGPAPPQRLNNLLETKYQYSEAVFVTEKRLTGSDLDDGEGHLSIPEDQFYNAHLFNRRETQMLDNGSGLPVRLVEVDDAEPVETLLWLRKSNKEYRLKEKWNEVKRRNEKKFNGVDGLHAVIQLWFFRYRSKLYFALHVPTKTALIQSDN